MCIRDRSARGKAEKEEQKQMRDRKKELRAEIKELEGRAIFKYKAFIETMSFLFRIFEMCIRDRFLSLLPYIPKAIVRSLNVSIS